MYEWYIIETNEVFYVGKGHNDRYKKSSRRNRFFQEVYKNNKCSSRIVMDGLSEDEAYEQEYKFIKYYRENTDYHLTNLADGGRISKNWKQSKESKEKISKSSKKLWSNKEFKEKVVKLRNDPNSVYQSKEFKEKISSLVQGENNPNYNHKWSDEMKKCLSNKLKKSQHNKKGNNPKAKKIYCVETEEIFDCIEDAREKYHVQNESSFSVALDNLCRTAAGLHWVSYPYYQDKQELLYLSLITKKRNTPIVCLETGEIYLNSKNLHEKEHISSKKIKKIKEEGFLEIDNKRYVLLELLFIK